MTAGTTAERRLRALTRTLYEQFGNVTGRRGWADMAPAMDDAAERKRVAELTPEEYRHLAWHGLSWARHDPAAVKYFLPRLLDGLAGGALPFDAAMVAEALRDSAWLRWPKGEARTVQEWFGGWWDAVLSYPVRRDDPCGNCGSYPANLPPGRAASDVLLWLAYAGVDVGPLLDRWRADGSPEAAWQLAEFVHAQEAFLAAGRLCRWDLVWTAGVDPAVEAQVVRWLADPATAAAIERAFFAAGRDEEMARYLSDAGIYLAYLPSELPRPSPPGGGT